jgi:hypothetical protein
MSKFQSSPRNGSQGAGPAHQFEDKIQYLLFAEEQILQAISARSPLREILNSICIALDRGIGNMISFISLPEDVAGIPVEISPDGGPFGLHVFFSERFVTDNHEELGSLAMYCSIPDSPSTDEFQLIERAMCLATIAIRRDNETKNDIARHKTDGRATRQPKIKEPHLPVH